jgi:large subunit ribosomal protein L25
MEFQRLEVRARTGRGKGSSRKLRADGRIPGVVYGRGIDPVAIDLAPRDLRGALLGPRRRNTVLNMVVKTEAGADRELLVMLQEHQVHPRNRHIMHADFLLVDLERDVEVSVPLITTGKCNGVQMGGILLQMFHELPIRCKPDDIPVEIEHDITELNIGQSIKAGQLTLPEGVTVGLEADQAVIAVSAPEAEEEKPAEEEEEGAEGEEKEGEEKEGEEKKEEGKEEKKEEKK